jgi:adenylate kinase family enzyme
VAKVEEFANTHENWIIDGNYVSTVEQRVKLADTIVLLDFDTELCINNAIGRTKKERGADMAKGFDNSKIKDEFIEFIKNFKQNTLPRIMAVLENYKDKNIVILKNYEEVDRFIENF